MPTNCHYYNQMNINRLEIFTSKGYKIPTQSTKTVTFTIIGSTYRMDRNYGWREDATGYFVVDENCKIISHVIENPGSTYGFDPSTWNTSIDYYDATLKLIDEIIVTVTVGDKTYSKSFTNIDNEENIFKYFDIATGMKKEFVRAQTSNERDNVVYSFHIESIMPKDQDFFLDDFFRSSLENDNLSLSQIYPSTQFLGSIDLDAVSAGLAGVETLFILEMQEDGSYKRPTSSNQMLRIEVPSNSNVKFVKYVEEYVDEDLTDEEYNVGDLDYSKVYWSDYKVFDLVNEDPDGKEDEPLVVTIGFRGDEEGCYQDILSFYTMDNISNPEKDLSKSSIGYLSVHSEVIGEDERYRTLFTNFGIPDPKEYQSVFKEIPIHEEGQDWDFINKKSKQLFLSYSEIFPYVGTYKALINAVKFLGYDDIYFKEWFMHFDGNFESKVSYESLDVSTGMTLQSKLKRTGVSLEDFIEWKKLNQLSLIYKINTEDEEYDDIKYYKKDGNEWYLGSARFEIPSTKAVYSYLNLEVLTKLFSLKEWLEKYILNINCQIIDVTGEGVYFVRFKETVYSSGYETFAEEKEEHISPIFDIENSSLSLTNSEASIDCTLKEIKNGLSFADLSDKKVKTYINKIFESFDQASLNEMKKDEWYDSSIIGFDTEDYCIVGKPASISMPFEELQYELSIDTSCGTMKNGVGAWVEDERTKETKFEEIPLLVLDNEMYVFKDKVNEIEFTEHPVIRIKNGILKKPFGNWSTNTKYTIQTYFDTKARHTRYTFQCEESGFHKEYNDYVTLYPRYVSEEDGTKRYISKLKYTSNNKYNIPMLVIENYDTYDGFFLQEKKSELMKEYLDASSAISSDFENSSRATEEELELLEAKRDTLHQEAISRWHEQLEEFSSVYDSSSYVEGFNKFILIINEGFIEENEISKDADVEHTVKVVFEPDYTSNGGEQKIFTRYNYRSKMCPAIEFDSSTYDARYQALKDEYKETIAHLEELKEDVLNLRGAILEDSEYQYAVLTSQDEVAYYLDLAAQRERDKQDYITTYNTSGGKGKALGEYLNWMIAQNSSGETRYTNLASIAAIDLENRITSIKDRFLHEYDSLKEKAYTKLLKDLETLKDECFTFYKDKKFTVNHIGDYTLTVKGVDGYNAPFANKGNSTVNVSGMYSSILMLDNNENDADGTIDKSDVSIGSTPKFWPNFRRQITSTSTSESSLEYESKSYILDTPKDKDFLKVSNLSERVNKIIYKDKSQGLSDNQIKIILNDENPQEQNLFYKGALLKLFFIDKNTNELVDSDEQLAGPYIVSEFKNIPQEDTREDDDNYILLEFSSSYEEFKTISQEMVDEVNNKTIDCYASLCSKMEVSLDGIKNDYSSKTAEIRIHNDNNYNNLAFKAGQCIKLEFSQMTYAGETPDSTNPDKKQEIVSERYNSGTSYRIKEAWYDSSSFDEVYVIDGLVNSDLLVPEVYFNGIYNFLSENPSENIKSVPYRVRCTMSPAHTTYSSYIIQAVGDTDEDGKTGRLSYKDNWNAKDYLDPTFSFTISKFNVYDAFRDWFKETSSKVFSIHREPAYNSVGNNIIVIPQDDNNTYDSGEILNIWDVFVNQGKSQEDNILAYQVINDHVPITLNYKGEYHFVLTSIDKYGNRLVNKSNGFLKT